MSDRQKTRLMWLVEEMGAEKFRQTVSKYIGYDLKPGKHITVCHKALVETLLLVQHHAHVASESRYTKCLLMLVTRSWASARLGIGVRESCTASSGNLMASYLSIVVGPCLSIPVARQHTSLVVAAHHYAALLELCCHTISNIVVHVLAVA